MTKFQWNVPCDPSDLGCCRERIGEEGVHPLSVTANMHSSCTKEEEIEVDTIFQEKNITHPIDTKLLIKIIERYWHLCIYCGAKPRRTFQKAVKEHGLNLRWNRHSQKAKMALEAKCRLKLQQWYCWGIYIENQQRRRSKLTRRISWFTGECSLKIIRVKTKSIHCMSHRFIVPPGVKEPKNTNLLAKHP